MKFDQVPLGNTGLKAGRLGLGTAYGLGAKEILWAVDQGINYVFWGSARRGNVVKAVRSLGPARRDHIIIATATYGYRFIPKPWVVRLNLEIALRRLRTDYLDIFQLGWLGSEPPEEIVDLLLNLKEKGLIRHLGISSHDRKLAASLLQSSPFEVFMIRYNAAHRGAEREFFPFVEPSKQAVISYTATRWGHLLRPPPGWPEKRPTPRAVDCYRFVLSQPKVTLCLTGAKNIRQLKENLRALELGPMSEEELSWMREFGDLVHLTRVPRQDPDYWREKIRRLFFLKSKSP